MQSSDGSAAPPPPFDSSGLSWLGFEVSRVIAAVANEFHAVRRCLIPFLGSFENSTFVALTSVAVCVVVLYVLYRFLLFPSFHKAKPMRGNFDHRSVAFRQRRANHFPPPYPNGWFKLCDVSDLKDGNIVSVSALGVDMVVFQSRDADGAIGVLDAFCPHLGAHLGQGGIVVGNCIVCPFHRWHIDASGKAVKIPYSTAPVPPSAKTSRAHHFCVWLDMVWLWYHAEHEPPLWSLAPRTNVECMVRHGTRTSQYDMHCMDMAENAADYYHFNHLHRTMALPVLRHLVHMEYDTELSFPPDPSQRHICYFTNFTKTFVLKRFQMAHVQKTVVTFEGPGLVHFDIQTPLGNLWLVKSILPRGPFDTYSEDAWYAERRVPRWFVRLIADVARGALEQDREVWENRLFTSKPHLVKGDGPFSKIRQWFDQFYSENSLSYDAAAQRGGQLLW